VIRLEDFEGIAGFRWGFLLDPGGEVIFSENAPAELSRQMGLLGRILAQAPFRFEGGDFLFQGAKVVMRVGDFGHALLFFENTASHALVDILIEEDRNRGEPVEDMSLAGLSLGGSQSGSHIAIQSFDRDSESVPEDVVDDLLRLFTQQLGPLAPMLAKKKAAQIGLHLDRLVVSDWSNLLNAMGAMIESEPKRETFLDAAVMLKTRF